LIASRLLLAAGSVAWLGLALALGVVLAWRVGLALAYGGGRVAFDDRYERSVSELASEQASALAAVEQVAANWRPNTLWQRELLWGSDRPARFCHARAVNEQRAALAIDCRRIEIFSPPRAGGPLPDANPDLADYAHQKAVWLGARALRMSGRWRSELTVTIVQSEPHATGGTVQYIATLTASDDAPDNGFADYAARRLQVTRDQVSGLSAPNRAVARLVRRRVESP
jgi:hypothetical protein